VDDTTIINLSHLMALQKRFDLVANNIANSRTTGFRSQQLSFQEYLQPSKGQEIGVPGEPPPSMVQAAYAFTSSVAGAVQITGNPLDLAIQGNAYFAVQTTEGVRYTRDGSFSLDGTGRLVTLSGQPVLSDNGVVTVSPQAGGIKIDPDGQVSTKQGTVGRLRLVRFPGGANLQAAGGNLIQSNQPPTDIQAGTATMLQGAIELSNVEATMEMTRATEITRSYELAAKLLKESQDATSLNQLANVPE
jgi:flagellar basal-body rod protein FlgF